MAGRQHVQKTRKHVDDNAHENGILYSPIRKCTLVKTNATETLDEMIIVSFSYIHISTVVLCCVTFVNRNSY